MHLRFATLLTAAALALSCSDSEAPQNLLLIAIDTLRADHVGRLLDGLRASEAESRTVVVLVSDHGEEFGEYGAYKHGTNLFREVMRVPLAMRAPSLSPLRIEEPIGLIDVLPTLLDLLGVATPRAPGTGRSLVPLLLGEKMPEAPVLAELRLKAPVPADAYIGGRWKLIEGTPPP